MSRIKNFTRNLAASYVQLAVNVVYSLVSIPLILHYLPKAEFGLWAMLIQLMGYASLVDLGMTSAVARLLVDHKDHRADGGYGSLVKTSFLVSAVQGMIVALVVLLAAPALAAVMKVPAEHAPTFVVLLRLQGLIVAFGFCLRPLAQMLYAHQREYVSTLVSTTTLMISLAVLWLFLAGGRGIYSFIYAGALSAVLTPALLFWNCLRFGFLPHAGQWGSASWKKFRELFTYGKDIFLMGLGYQLTVASQTIIVSRALGLEAAAAWAVGTKMFNLIVPLMNRPFGAALPGLFEMLARGETGRLRARFRDMVVLTASLGALLGVSFALCNSLFIEIWTSGRIAWPPLNDLLLGCWVFLLSLTGAHANFVTVTKEIGGMRYVFFMEGLCFVTLAVLVGSRFGVSGIIATSIVCTALFSFLYGLYRSRDYFRCGWLELAIGWVRPSWRLVVILAPLSAGLWVATIGLPSLWRLAIHGSLAVSLGVVLFLRLGLPRELIQNLGERLPQPALRLLRLFVPCKG